MSQTKKDNKRIGLIVAIAMIVILIIGTIYASNQITLLTQLSDYIKPVTVTTDINPSTIQSTIVQAVGCQSTSGTTNICAFTNPVSVLNGLLVCAGATAILGFNTPTDTINSTYGSKVNKVNVASASCWGAFASSSGADTVTFTTTTACTGGCGFCIFELNGVMQLDSASQTGGATNSIPSTTNLAFINHPVFTAIIASATAQGTFTSGANFNALLTGSPVVNCEYSMSGVTSPTSFPATLQNSVTWAEIGTLVQSESNLPPINLNANTNYMFTAQIYETEASSSTVAFAIHELPDSAILNVACVSALTTSATGYQNSCTSTENAQINPTAISASGLVTIYGQINVGSVSGSLTIDFANIAQVGTVTIKTGSSIKVEASSP